MRNFPLRRPAWIAGLVVSLVAADASAAVIGGGGSRRTDCLGVFEAAANSPAGRPRNIRCVDGEACDGDGVVNGVCEFDVGYCANSSQLAGCTLQGVAEVVVDNAEDDGIDPDFNPQFQALQTRIDSAVELPEMDADECSATTTFRVPVRGPFGSRNRCGSGRMKLVVTTFSTSQDGRLYRDRDIMRLQCRPSREAGGCDPQVFFGSTFDRVQQQIFTPSCATSTCHDSESTAADLLLEDGASRANLINVTPRNGAAMDAGWLRVDQLDPNSADLVTSFLYRKVTGDLPSKAYGLRMPRKRPRLNRQLIEVLEVWIENGAPDESAGWLPGTF